MARQEDLNEAKLDADNSHQPLALFIKNHERAIVFALCALAALRIFFFAAAFPFFNVIDEQSHLDTVIKYKRGFLPDANLPVYDREAVELIVNFTSLEALNSRAYLDRINYIQPVWCVPSFGEAADNFAKEMDIESKRANVEAHSLPIYYVIAGAWYAFGKILGFKGLALLYWLRFFNIAPYTLLVFLSHKLAGDLFPDNLFMRISIPLLTAVFPQDVFFGIHREVLSAPLTTLSLLLLLRLYLSETKNIFYYLFTGLSVGCACLIDITNLILILPAITVLLLKLKKVSRSRLGGEFFKAGWTLCIIVIPVGGWLLRNYFVLGDVMASKAKAKFLGWTIKPLSQWVNHPIFTPSGFLYFFDAVMKNFWRGEYYWYGVPLASTEMDVFYTLSSYTFIIIFVINLLRLKKGQLSKTHLAEFTFLILFVGSVLFLLLISLPYDFGKCFYPSREHPYFVSGRIISGMLVPFLVIYLRGFESVLKHFRHLINPFAAVLLIAILITFSEIYISLDVINSGFNFFAMLSANRTCP